MGGDRDGQRKERERHLSVSGLSRGAAFFSLSCGCGPADKQHREATEKKKPQQQTNKDTQGGEAGAEAKAGEAHTKKVTATRTLRNRCKTPNSGEHQLNNQTIGQQSELTGRRSNKSRSAHARHKHTLYKQIKTNTHTHDTFPHLTYREVGELCAWE